jgi:acyl-homoserine-lactone acylase
MTRMLVRLAPLGLAALLAACATPTAGPDARTATIQRTAHGVPHISAPDLQTLAYGVAYAYAQDNVCMVADQLVTARGERSRWFGGTASALLGRRMLPNEQIDLFIAAHMDDAALAGAWERGASAEARSMVRGFVDGYNRFLADHAGRLPAACNAQPWVRPMTQAEYFRASEILMTQAGIAALADAMIGARPPAPATAAAPGVHLSPSRRSACTAATSSRAC